LANRKTSLATVAVTHDADSLVKRGLLTTAEVRGPVRAGRVYGWYFLPASSERGLPELIVDFRQLFSVPLDLLTRLSEQGNRRARLAVPFREHLAFRRPLRTEPLWPRESAGSTVACGDWDRAMRGERRAEVGLRWWGRGYQR